MHAVATLLLLVLALLPGSSGAQTSVQEPGVKGDQLLFFYDARTDRVPFLSVTNPSGEAITVEVAFYDQALATRLGTVTAALAGAGQVIIDPTTAGGGFANGNAGLAVVTPVLSDADRTPVVPPAPLVGGFTLANLQLSAAFGENPFARFAVRNDGSHAAAGAVVNGNAVKYQSIVPPVLVIPSYYDPETLAPPSEDGNRVILVAFGDQYGDRFDVVPSTATADALFIDASGVLVAQDEVVVSGVLSSDLQALAGDAVLSSSGKAFFAVTGAAASNLFGVFSQALGTFAAGQRMPALDEVPELPLTPPPTPTPAPTPTPDETGGGGGGTPTPGGGATPTPGGGGAVTPTPGGGSGATPTPGPAATPTPTPRSSGGQPTPTPKPSPTLNLPTPTPNGGGGTPTPPGGGGTPTPGLATPTPGGGGATPTPGGGEVCGGCLDEASSIVEDLLLVVGNDLVPTVQTTLTLLNAIPLVDLVPGAPELRGELDDTLSTGQELVLLLEEFLGSSVEQQCAMIDEVKGLAQQLLDQAEQIPGTLGPLAGNPVLSPIVVPAQALISLVNGGALTPLLGALVEVC